MPICTRPLVAVATALGVALAVAAPVDAHVTIPDPAEQGGFSIVTFSVPNERPDAGTTTVEVKLPEDHPLPFVSVQPKTGWEVETTMRTLEEPVEAFGEEVTEVVDTVVWSGGTIEAGQFDTFALSVGPLPDDVEQLTFPTVQTYSSGEEVAWIQETPEGGEEPERPAPTLRLTAAGETETEAGGDGSQPATVEPTGDDAEGSPSTAAGATDDDGTDPLAVAALVVALLAAAGAGFALASSRRRPAGADAGAVTAGRG
ncbi:MAG TPA: YcnI family protein [Aquihabitans sp.]|jgi:uncharacterized protein YcnI|nr:YcnI family protein [Aquihabitans sp.]